MNSKKGFPKEAAGRCTVGSQKFRTLKGYRQASGNALMEAMEDYLEMIFQIRPSVRIGNLTELNVGPSSCFAMVRNL